MHFIKVVSKQDRHRKEKPQWILRLYTMEELFNYLKGDKDAWQRAMMANRDSSRVDVSHKGSRREEFLKYVEGLKFLPHGTTVWPTMIIEEMMQSKGIGMLNYLQRGLTVRINENGGYCDYESWVEMWDMEILEERHLDTYCFPNDNTPKECDVLILENAGTVNPSIEYLIRDLYPNASREYVLNLKEQDPKWLMQSIMNAKVIAANTLALDQHQVIDMIRLMMNVPRKKIIIQSTDFSRIMEYPKFWEFENRHEVVLVPDVDKIKMMKAVQG